MTVSSIAIAGRRVGPEHPPYVIAEISANHNGSLERAFELIAAAAEAGADAVKFQTYTADSITLDSDRPEFLIEGGLWHGRRLHELYAEAHTPWEWHVELFAYARGLGITPFSSPFDASAVDLLASLDAPAYKIASFEINDLPLIACAAAQHRPIIASTGAAEPEEVEAALATAREAGAAGVVLLHCVSSYPAPPAETALRTIPAMCQRYRTPVGLSDHTMGTAVAVAAVALGACVIEKHLTIAREDGGPDAAFSLEPPELTLLVRDVRLAWEALGEVRFGPAPSAMPNLAYRRSLYVAEDVAAGEMLTAHNVRSVRPALGMAPARILDVLGRRAARGLRRGEPLTVDMLL